MKCNSCNIEISKEFIFALKANSCPACGKSIMKPEQVGAYFSLCELLRSFVQEANVEKVATSILANFELKQIFKVPDATVTQPSETMAITKSETMTVEEPVIMEDGVKLEVIDKDKARANQSRLQQMRDEALNGALGDRYGVEMGEEGIILAEDPVANSQLVQREQRRADARNAVLDGSGGKNSFRRG